MLGQKWQVFRSLHSLAINYFHHQQEAIERWGRQGRKAKVQEEQDGSNHRKIHCSCAMCDCEAAATSGHLCSSLRKCSSVLKQGLMQCPEQRCHFREIDFCVISPQSGSQERERCKETELMISKEQSFMNTDPKRPQALALWICNPLVWLYLFPLLQVAFPDFSSMLPLQAVQQKNHRNASMKIAM